MNKSPLGYPLAKYFIWKEALWLPSWGRMAIESDGLNDQVIANLQGLFQKMDMVREFFNEAIMIHVAYRPTLYNAAVHGAMKSAHIAENPGEAACDFHVEAFNCDVARSRILDWEMLEHWGMRMEDRPGSNWIHLDTRIPPEGHPRFFKP